MTPRKRKPLTPSSPSSRDKANFEKVGSGRGGFSVKGAAAAAARARWDKVRREKAERGEESDEERPKRRATGGARVRDRAGVTAETTVGE